MGRTAGPRPTPSSAYPLGGKLILLNKQWVRGTHADQGVRPTIWVRFPMLGKVRDIGPVAYGGLSGRLLDWNG